MSKRERYKILFKQSKAVVKDWEGGFFAQNDRKPSRTDIASAPEKVLVAYKNCKKIKLYFEKESQSSKPTSPDDQSRLPDEESRLPDEGSILPDESCAEETNENISFSGLFPKSETKSRETCKDISNIKVWGEHLNKKSTPTPAPANHKFVGKLDFSFDKSFTRTSIKKKKTRLENKSHSFFGSLGDDFTLLGDLSQSSFLDVTQNDTIFCETIETATLDETANHLKPKSTTVPPSAISDDSASVDLIPIATKVKTSCEASKKSIQNNHERKIDSSWLKRCAASDDFIVEEEKICVVENDSTSTKEKSSENECKSDNMEEDHDDIIVATPKKTESVPRLLSSVSTPTNFKGLFAAKKTEESEAIAVPEPVCTSKSKSPAENKVTPPPKKKATKKRKRSSDSEDEEYKPIKNTKSKNGRKAKNDNLDDDDNESDYEEKSNDAKKPKSKRARKSKTVNKNDTNKNSEVDEHLTETPLGPSNINLFELGFEENVGGTGGGKGAGAAGKKTFMTPEQRLSKNVSSGKANENYRKIDLKKKTYTKGGGRGKFLMMMEFKKKLAAKEGKTFKELKCYRCGETGHFATRCTGGAGDTLIPQDVADELDPGNFATLDEVKEKLGMNSQPAADSNNGHVNLDQEDEELLEAVRQCEPQAQAAELNFSTESYFSTENFDRDTIYAALKKFGYSGFRDGQEEGISRILRGESSLVLLATGSGKSLIYQLPAYLYAEKYGCITIVVSPLVSLMEDQVTGLPSFLKAAALHYNLTPKAKEKIIEQVKSGKLHFLLVSPEAVSGGGGAFGALIPHLPPIGFVCIDEAHCVSQWSHNFRPSYLRLAKVIREKLRVKTILGLTATAPERMIESVSEQLGVPSEGVIRGPLLPNNLTLSVSRDEERDMAMLALLSEGGALATCESVIVYCTRRDDCERIASFLRTKLQEREYQMSQLGNNRVRYSATAEPYHAGLTPHRRKTVQNHFMTGKLRVVVATVAFGMGIDKSDIRAIVHYNMPKSFESYIQEIGRAGRDGKPARCHLFLEAEGKDLSELKRHIYSNSMDRFTLRKLLHMVFDINGEKSKSEYKEVALPIASTVEALDLPEENISTILCYLESGLKDKTAWVKLANPVYSCGKVQCYGGPQQLRIVAASCPPLAAAIAIQRQRGVEVNGAFSIEFPVVEVSCQMGWNSALVKKELKNLEWRSTPMGWRKTGVLVEFSNLSFHLEAKNGITEDELDELQEELYDRSKNQEYADLSNLYRLFRAFNLVSYRHHDETVTATDLEEKSDKLKHFLSSYFKEPEKILEEVKNVPTECKEENSLRDKVRDFVMSNGDNNWNGRAVARVMHGIQSPNFQAKVWGRSPAWRSALNIDFNLLVKIATDEILRIRTGK